MRRRSIAYLSPAYFATHQVPDFAVERELVMHNGLSQGLTVSGERMHATEQIVHNDANAPNIDLFTIGLSGPDLRRHIDGGATIGAQHFPRQDLTYAEIRQFEQPLRRVGSEQ